MKRILPLFLVPVLSACGGSGGSGEDNSIGFANTGSQGIVREGQVYNSQISLKNASEEAVVTVSGLPNWASFNSDQLIISGQPSHEDAGQTYHYVLTVTDGDETFTSSEVSLSVKHSDLQISTGIQSPSVLQETATYSTQTVATGDLTSFNYSVINAPQWLMIDADSGLLSGVPSHVDAGKTYSGIQVRVSDGLHIAESEPFEIVVTYIPLEFINSFDSVYTNEDIEINLSVDLVYNPGVIFSATNLPNWMAINPSTGLISGTATSDLHAGNFEGITVTATDQQRSITSQAFTIGITPVNDAPIITAKTFSLNEYQPQYTVSYEYSDEETPTEDLILSVFTASNDYQVSINPDKTITIDIVNDEQVALNGITFDVSVNDGEQTAIIIFNENITENDQMNVSANLSGDVFTNQNLVLTFDQPLSASALSTQQTIDNVSCDADIQVSFNNFETCTLLSNIATSSTVKEYDFNYPLGINQTYKVRLKPAVQSVFGNSVAAVDIAEFFTLSGLMITEVGGKQHYDALHWFEVYNASRSPIDLSEYKLRTRAINSATCSGSCFVDNDHEFTLNPLVIQPGQYAIVRGQSWYNTYTDADRITYVKNGDYYPYWDADGMIELININANETADFVVFGSWSDNGGQPSPVTSTAWVGGVASAPSYNSNDSYQRSLARSVTLQDSNESYPDWSTVFFATPAGPNDVSDYSDNDQDGLPDAAEVEGATYAGISLYDLGARVGIKDIFIEVDYMNSSDEGVVPREEALQKVVDAFAQQDIAVHFDVGDLFDQSEGINTLRFDLGGGNQVAYSAGVGFDVADTRTDIYDIKRNNMDYARLPIFHYLLMANSQNADGSDGSSGVAEMFGNDLAITLGGWGLNSTNTASLNKLINIQASTIMHELGHNLGLRHGGDENTNYKPNYLSVMNYLYQLYGLPEIGNNEGDRYYNNIYQQTGGDSCIDQATAMTNPFDGDYNNFVIDYSSSYNAISEDYIYESSGLRASGSTGVDFNCDGDAIDGLEYFDLNGTGTIETLTGYNDWQNIELIFQRYFPGNDHGATFIINNQPNDLILLSDVVGDDKSEVVHEQKPHQALMDMIRNN